MAIIGLNKNMLKTPLNHLICQITQEQEFATVWI